MSNTLHSMSGQEHSIPEVKLTDEIVTLKPMTLEDAEAHLAGDDDEQAKWLGGKSTEKSIRDWIVRNQEHWKNGGPIYNFGIYNHDDQLVGMVDANTDFENLEGVAEGDANISYALYPEARGKGYMTRAVMLLEQFLTEKGIKHDVIRMSPKNEASLAVPARLGYEDKGEITTKDGEVLRVFRKEL